MIETFTGINFEANPRPRVGLNQELPAVKAATKSRATQKSRVKIRLTADAVLQDC